MFAFLRKGLRKQGQSDSAKRAAHDELMKLETEYQLRINELNRKIEKQQQRQQEILEKGKRASAESVRRDLAVQYTRTERQMRRLSERCELLVKAQEVVEDRLANIDLQDVIPEEILNLNHPEAQRERARADMVRDRLDQAYDDMVASFKSTTSESQSDTHMKAAIQAALDLFDRERDEEFKLTLQAIEQDLGATATDRFFARSDQRAREIE